MGDEHHRALPSRLHMEENGLYSWSLIISRSGWKVEAYEKVREHEVQKVL